MGSKQRVPSILALLNSSASSKVGPSGTEIAKNVALQGDGVSRGEVYQEGFEVAETRRPQANPREVAGDYITPVPPTAGSGQRRGEGQDCGARKTEPVQTENEVGHVLCEDA